MRLILNLLAVACFAQSSIESEMLAAHNAVRVPLRLRPLSWSDKLAARAQEWAETLLARGEFIHRPKSPYGENLFAIAGAYAAPEQVVKSWAAESSDYDYSSNWCRKVCGHYTQLVWSSTQKVGCGVARSSRREVWVCDYDPPGSFVGKRPY
jgi:pathogenesis-related protein 1